ncbi:septum site-determining protein MinC [Pelosinus sp. sgz500959]|uniref:septum site-determining protein MinC n=1 Tax=Pelosinus sp. sgz500959 TaxID=3242472 RepID=UPI0036736196
MRQYVMFKGSRNGLQLVLDDSVDFAVILDHLKSKLESAVVFFTEGTIVEVATKVRVLTTDQQEELTKLLAMYGLIFRETPRQDEIVENSNVESEELQILTVAKTIRSGQEVIYNGSVVIIGDVNPGAEVIAGGDIIIRGTCRGVVHAGAYGNTEATITANRLLASQIRIASLIARAPDHLDQPEYTEVARIQDGHVIIETVDI